MHYFTSYYTPFYSPYGAAVLAALLPIILIVALWVIIVKGFALWHAARGDQKVWFIVMLVVNTLGILELIYLIWFRRNSSHHSLHAPEHHSSAQA